MDKDERRQRGDGFSLQPEPIVFAAIVFVRFQPRLVDILFHVEPDKFDHDPPTGRCARRGRDREAPLETRKTFELVCVYLRAAIVVVSCQLSTLGRLVVVSADRWRTRPASSVVRSTSSSSSSSGITPSSSNRSAPADPLSRTVTIAIFSRFIRQQPSFPATNTTTTTTSYRR